MLFVRCAVEADIPALMALLVQVNRVHYEGRPDLFKPATKYTEDDLRRIFQNDELPVFVCVDDDDRVLGHGFCVFQQHVNSNLLTDVKTLYIDGVAYKILSFRVGTDGFAYVGLRGIPDRNAAELFRGKTVEGAREDAPALDEGQYYIVDIIGLSCETEEGEFLGTVTDISNLSSDIYTIEKAGKKILFPAVKGVVKKVDIQNKKLIVDKAVFEQIAVD